MNKEVRKIGFIYDAKQIRKLSKKDKKSKLAIKPQDVFFVLFLVLFSVLSYLVFNLIY